PFVPGSLRDPVENAMRYMKSGSPFRDALAHWDTNSHLRPLAHILTESMESGISSLPALDALGRDALARLRRETDTALKRLPVTMLFPLVTCILPAFIFLSVLPTLISGFTSLQW